MGEVNGIVWILYHEYILNHNLGAYLIIVEVQIQIVFMCTKMWQSVPLNYLVLTFTFRWRAW